MDSLLLLMILLPLGGSILNGLVLRTPYPKRAGVIASLFAGSSFAIAVTLWSHLLSTGTPIAISFDWFKAGIVDMKWGFQFDHLTALMSLIVTGIGTVIHIYSIGYMSDEKTPSRYFAYLNLFLFSMLSLITADNLTGLFVGWEGVGLCSYLLIGYWYQDIEKARAGMKAFIVNRIGDAGFLIGIFLCIELFSSVNFSSMASAMHQPALDLVKLNWAAFFLFVGAMGKSAQIPLYVWLPDAMAGPTPVSALIHAATMVTAGVYLVARMNFLYSATEEATLFIGCIGGATALLAALIATSQNDIKKVLAYSTVSQLGLMFLALGSGAYLAAVFHLMTHAFFKALLFLGAGSVIHALGGEQDIQKMGGLRSHVPVTFWTFLIGTAAIAGLPPLAGFFSKDLILYSTLGAKGGYGMIFWTLGSVTSLLTAFYMTRLFALTFLGQYRGHEHPHESPAVMTLPLCLLAVGSLFAGFLEVPEIFHFIPGALGHFLQPVIPLHAEAAESGVFLTELGAMGLATGAAVVGISVGLLLFINPSRAKAVGVVFRPLAFVFENKFWVDEIYAFLIVNPFRALAGFLAKFFDPRVVDAAIIFPSRVCRVGATVLSFIQMGSAQFYLLVMLFGGLAVLWVSLKGTMVF